ncbi:MAG: hypothetical protein IJ424_01145 [Oscillospiraceae bacterium]|nr:hypothetical protein [Oscillospiraceae bacterium]
MIENDTIKLLRECNAGVKMGVASIDDVLGHVHSNNLKNSLIECKAEHQKLDADIQSRLSKFHDDGKAPSPMAKRMSWMMTNMKLAVNDSDAKIADLMTDGCNMGIKSLNRYLNEYKAADEHSKDIAKRLIKIEQTLARNVRDYL